MLERNGEGKRDEIKEREKQPYLYGLAARPQDCRLLRTDHCQTHYFAVIGKPESSQTRQGEAPKQKGSITGTSSKYPCTAWLHLI